MVTDNKQKADLWHTFIALNRMFWVFVLIQGAFILSEYSALELIGTPSNRKDLQNTKLEMDGKVVE